MSSSLRKPGASRLDPWTTRAAVVLGCGALLGGAATGFAELSTGELADGPRSFGTAKKAKRLRIKGSVDGLVPGTVRPLRLRVRNPNPFRLRVRRIRVKVGAAGPGCGAGHVTIPSFKGRVRLRAHRRKRIVLPASMSALAPDACQQASFPLTYRGRARRPR